MAKRRIISQDLIADEDFNALSLEAQSLFMRMLSVSDDCGIVPATPYTLTTLTNPPQRVLKNLDQYVLEIVASGLGVLFEYNGKQYFAFKRESFDEYQRYLISKRTRSEYLKLKIDAVFELISASGNFQEILGKSRKTSGRPIERIKSKDVDKEEGGVGGDPPPRPVAITIPANTGDEIPVYEDQANEFAALYPAVDVPQQLRSMRAWCLANQARRKTPDGMMKFVNNWLSKEQNRAQGQRPNGAPQRDIDYLNSHFRKYGSGKGPSQH